jgi:hypothetical protein
MLRFPISSLTLTKQKMLTTCASVPRFYVTVEGHEHDSNLGAVVYNLQVGIQDGKDVVTHTIQARFSQMEVLDKKLRGSLAGCAAAKPFPPKQWLFNTNERFVRTRSADLQRYFDSLVQVRNLGTNPEFCGFFQM